MAHQSGTICVPPLANVRVIECRDYMALVPLAAYRDFFGYGKINVQNFPSEGNHGLAELIKSLPGDEEAWVAMSVADPATPSSLLMSQLRLEARVGIGLPSQRLQFQSDRS